MFRQVGRLELFRLWLNHFSKTLFLVRTSFFLSCSPLWKNPWPAHESLSLQVKSYVQASQGPAQPGKVWGVWWCKFAWHCLVGRDGIEKWKLIWLLLSLCDLPKNFSIPTTSLGSRAVFHWAPGLWLTWGSLKEKSTCPVAACAPWGSLLQLDFKTLKMF